MKASCSSISPARGGNSISGPGVEEEKTKMDCNGREEELDPCLWGNLAEDILDKIIARLPLKYMFQARVFSKEWNAKVFSSSAFQEEVMSTKSSWPTYCPFHMLEGTVVGYDSVADEWKKVFSYDQQLHGTDVLVPHSHCFGAGSLICTVREDDDDEPLTVDTMYDRRWLHGSMNACYEIVVTNVVLGKTRTLPSRPKMQKHPLIVHVVPGSNSYKVILVSPLEGMMPRISIVSPLSTQIYDSASNSWTMNPAFPLDSTSEEISRYVYLDGVFYIVVMPLDERNRSCRFLVYSVESGTWIFSDPQELRCLRDGCTLHLCGKDVLLVMNMVGFPTINEVNVNPQTGFSVEKDALHILKLDLITLQMSEVSRGPPERVKDVFFDKIIGHRDRIYFGGTRIRKTPLFVYHVRKQEWSRHPPFFNDSLTNRPQYCPWGKFALQPGLNPFVEV